MDTVTQVQNLDEAVCISHSIIWQPVYEKENSEFKPIKLHMKN